MYNKYMTEHHFLICIFSESQKELKQSKILYETFLKSYLPSNIQVLYVTENCDIMVDIQVNLPHILLNKTLPNPIVSAFQTIYKELPYIHGCLKINNNIIPNLYQIRQLFDQVVRSGTDFVGGASSPSYTDPMYYLSHNVMRVLRSNNPPDFRDVINRHGFSFVEYKLLYRTVLEDVHKFSVLLPRKQPILFVKLKFDLGNQMFQIAAAYGIAKQYQMHMIVMAYDTVCLHTADPYTFFHSVFKNVPHLHKTRAMVDNKYQEDAKDCWTYNPDILVNHGDGNQNVVLDGFFQTAKYFDDWRSEILDMFLREELLEGLRKRYPSAASSFFIHVRRGDYVNNTRYSIDQDTYYTNSIQYILERHPDAQFYVFSDDIEYCKTWDVLSRLDQERVSFVDKTLSDVLSLYLMSLCRMGGICANSTFSWWGSYLNKNLEKIVIMPKIWHNFVYDYQAVFYNGVVIMDS
jgi:Glycosyl transferase family 11